MSDEANKGQDRATARRESNVKALGSNSDVGRIRAKDILKVERVSEGGEPGLVVLLRCGKVLVVEAMAVLALRDALEGKGTES